MRNTASNTVQGLFKKVLKLKYLRSRCILVERYRKKE